MILKDVRVGRNVTIYNFVNAYHCTIADNTKIGSFVEIQKNVRIGENCKISSHSFLCEGVVIGNNVFVGHNVSFINDKYPRAVNAHGKLQSECDWIVSNTTVEEGASIGTSATILCGVCIGAYAVVGAGSVVTKDIPAYALVYGNPAVQHGYVCKCGKRLFFLRQKSRCRCGYFYKLQAKRILPQGFVCRHKQGK